MFLEHVPLKAIHSLVIHSREHQIDVIENLEAMIAGSGTGAQMHSNFWLSMERDQITKEFNWKTWFKIPTIYDEYVEGYCPIDSENDVEFWLTEPDENSISEHCAVMRINYNVTEYKNWESTICSTDQNGQLGESHGFVCIEDNNWKPIEESDCLVIFPTTTTTTTKSTTTSKDGSTPEGPGGEGSGGEGTTTSTSKTTSTKNPTNPTPDPNNPENSSTSPSSTTITTTTTTLEAEDVNVGIIIGGVLGGLLFLGLLIFLVMRCLKPDNAVEDEEDEIDMSA
ncbi:unnamed protein product [Oikopleura dioica]|uniref:C-type lectin domain-containing protein n=1 Tax=Oikopleura dioica TaxID=34765 RepID=E4X5Q6_OIKDI|nr:unnamed protein product [Oikopleura dioica]